LTPFPGLAASWTVEGRVVGVSGGDTIMVLDAERSGVFVCRVAAWA
jgi:hypothetical protein